MSKTLLLADDSVTIQKVVGISFANEDVVLHTVDNGDDAVTRARETRPDVVLADVVMPGKSGYEVCEAIKSDPELCHIPVLLLTGTFEPFDEDRARRAGANGHITKPFEAQGLVDHVNALLEGSHAAAPAPEATQPPPETTREDRPQVYDFFDDSLAHDTPSSGEEEAVAAGDDLDVGDGEEEALELEAAVEDLAPLDATAEASAVSTGLGSSEFEPTSEERATAGDLAVSPEPALLDEADLTGMGVPASAEAAPEPERPMGAASELPGRRSEPDTSLGALDDLPGSPGRASPADWGDTTGGKPFDLEFISPRPHPVEATAPALGEGSAEAEARQLEDPLAQLEADEVAGEALLDPEAARDHDVSVSDLGDPLADMDAPTARPAPAEIELAPEPVPTAVEPSEIVEPASLAGDSLIAPAASAPEAAPAPAAPGVSREMQQRLHESIEKIAWESFGDLSERIVREAVERVEAVAWEVIPQMAETLIREEIRRLKGEDDSVS